MKYCVFTILVALLLPRYAFASSSSFKVFFYNPESSINNFVTLKDGFDTYLSSVGAFEFQPFSDRSIFEEALTRELNAAILISSWHYRMLRQEFPLHPVLFGTFRGNSTQRHILCGHVKRGGISRLEGATIATASSHDYSRTVLQQMLGASRIGELRSTRFMTVPKDMDALLAIGFGVVDFAIATEFTVRRLAEISPSEFRQLHELAASEETLLPILATTNPADSSVATLVEHIARMADDTAGEGMLNLINLDSMHKITENELRLLRP